MTKKLKLSIQVKLLILLVTLPVVFLGLYLLLVFNLFEKDKIAYIFDSSMAVTKTVASQVRAETNVAINQLRPILKGFSSETKAFDDIAKDIFTTNESFHLLQVYGNQNGQFIKLAQISKEETKNEDVTYENNLLTNIEQNNIVMDLDKGNELIWFGIKHSNEITGEDLYILSLIKSPSLLDVFKGRSVYNKFLIKKTGEIIISPTKNSDVGTEKSFKNWSFLSKMNEQNFREGTIESFSPDGQRWLTSFTQVGVADWIILSNIKRDTALSAIDVLLKKSLLFFVALISLAVILSIFTSKKTTLGLRELASATLEVAKGNFSINLIGRSEDEIGMLANSFNDMAKQISTLMSQTAEKARMETELATAKAVQDTLFPSDYYQNSHVEISGHYLPASECGGDWWFYNEKDGIVQLWNGDATGHGAPAALITSAAKATVSIISQSNIPSPAQALELLNYAIYENSKGKMCMTFFVAFFNHRTGILEYANSGHDAPMLFRSQNGEFSKKTLEMLLEANGPRLGDRQKTKYSSSQILMKEGDVIFFYTDGIVEMHGENNELWGERKFIKYLIESLNKNKNLPEVIKNIVEESNKFRKDTPLADDVTFFGMRMRSKDELSTPFANTQTALFEVENLLPWQFKSIAKLVNLYSFSEKTKLSENMIALYDNLPMSQIIPRLCGLEHHNGRHFINIRDVYFYKHVALAFKFFADRKKFITDPVSEILEVFSREVATPFSSIMSKERWNEDKSNQFVWFFNSSDQKLGFLEDVEKKLNDIAGVVRIKHDIKLILDELFTNAIFNAPNKLVNGKRQKVNRQGRVFVSRDASIFIKVDVESNKVILGCVDQFGSLLPEEIFSRLNITYDLGLDKGMDMNSYGGSGIGMRLMLDRSDSLLISVNRKVETCVILTLPINVSKNSDDIKKTIHVVVV